MKLKPLEKGIEINDSRFSLEERERIVVRSSGATIKIETNYKYFVGGGVFSKDSLKKERGIGLLRKVEFMDENGNWNPYPSVFQHLRTRIMCPPEAYTFSLGVFKGILLYHISPPKTVDRALFENAQKKEVLVDLNGVDF